MSECVIMATPIVDALGSAYDSTTMRSHGLVWAYGPLWLQGPIVAAMPRC
jgi:hypothetical protein